MADPLDPPPPDRDPEMTGAIPFIGAGDSETAPLSAKPSEEPATSSEAPEEEFQIEWHDEEAPPHAGELFSSPGPEPPPQPFEIIRDPPKPHAEPARKPAAQTLATQPARSERPPLIVRMVWGWMPILLLLGGYFAVVATQGKIGYAWDEAYYYEPASKAADWLIDAATGKRPYDQASIDAAFEPIHEHPSVQKFLSGLAIRMFKDPRDHLYAMRLPMAILFGLSLTLIYLLGRRAWGVWPGLVAALIYATMPRLFGEAHFASMEPVLIFMTLLVVFCWLRGLDSAFWAAMTGIAFGLLLDTKINAFFLPIPLVLWSHLYDRKRYVNNLFAILTLGPLVMFACWPWLWPDPVNRMLDYLKFHAQHQQTHLYYMGQIWGQGGVNDYPNPPWHYPLMMIGVTVPVFSLALILLGALKTLLKLPRRPYAALFLMIPAFLLAIACAPSTPRYDGVRLFVQVFPFLALLGGSSLVTLIRYLEDYQESRRRKGRPLKFSAAKFALNGVLLIVLIEGGIANVRYYPYLLSYFNPLVGGVRGAEQRGFEVSYWNDALNIDVIQALNELPDGSKIDPLAMHELCLTQLQDWGLIKPSLRFGGDPPYDYHLLQFRRGFFTGAEKALADGGVFKPIAEWGFPGVPLMALYKTGLPFEEYRIKMRQEGVF